jgi:hypothetical protein
MKYIVGNNYQKYEPQTEKFEFQAAIVGDPKLNPYSADDNLHQKTVYHGVFDLDEAAFYPSTIVAFNIHPSTMECKLSVPVEQFISGEKVNNSISGDNYCYNDETDMAGTIIDDYRTGNISEIGYAFFNLPLLHNLYNRIIANRKK